MTDDTTPTEQPLRASRCPECGHEATEDSLRDHDLSALGYLHDDQLFECSDCGNHYAHGVPVGTPDFPATDLWCPVCELGFMRVHRVVGAAGGHRLHLKCDHHHPFECPHCDEDIAADGLRAERTGALTCPHCGSGVPRDEAPFCYYFDTTRRSADGEGRSLVGFPVITGNTEHADEAYGYEADESTPEGFVDLSDLVDADD